MEEQKRHSGFETMRILSMVMIVLMHGIGHGGLGSAAPQGSAAFWIYWLLFILARVSTNCFVMLSGYYLSERKGAVRAGRLFRIGAQVWFYSMLTFCVAVKAGAVPLSAISLLRALLPLTSNGYWFASAYFLMYLSVPVLNTVVQSLDRRQYKTLLLVALLLQSVWGTLFNWATDVTFVNNGYSFIWFYTLYFMAAYFRKYRVTVPSGLCLLAYLAASAAGLFNRMLALRVENALHLNGFVNTVNGYQALATVIASAAMFLLFQNIHIRSDYWRRWVFRLAPLSFGVYLLHDSDFTRALLWRLVDLPRFGGALLPSLAYLTGAVLLIAVAGYAVDAVYEVEVFARNVYGRTVRKMTAMSKAHGQHGITRLQKCIKYGKVGIRTAVRLNICMLSSKQLFCTRSCYFLNLVNIDATAVITLARVSFGIFICKNAARSQKHALRHDIFRRNKFNIMLLAFKLPLAGGINLAVKFL